MVFLPIWMLWAQLIVLFPFDEASSTILIPRLEGVVPFPFNFSEWALSRLEISRGPSLSPLSPSRLDYSRAAFCMQKWLWMAKSHFLASTPKLALSYITLSSVAKGVLHYFKHPVSTESPGFCGYKEQFVLGPNWQFCSWTCACPDKVFFKIPLTRFILFEQNCRLFVGGFLNS